ncbi:hypothetical protein DSO57_1031255 [Entomophthora muscae]|uniref:Uncharacterized protein n=1 Tax=Entomophthora muscae TaxID=34485 RepID=A0ACC2SQD8_9FUNG|nr:hypothetical protein DSO57_1031255 [Entomophthora muscae]
MKFTVVLGLIGCAIKANATSNIQEADTAVHVSSYDNMYTLVKSYCGTWSPTRGNGLALSPEKFFVDYQSYETMAATLEDWASQSRIATFIPSIGKTHEGRDIFAFKIATKENSNTKKSLVFNGGLHAREWISSATTIYLIHKLLEESDTPRIKLLLNGFEFHFTPLANPDGYEFSRLPGECMWRKNRRNNRDGSFGVDLNRNWDEHWSPSNISSAKDTYQGPYPHSEPEVQALANYLLAIPRGYGGIDFHSYSQLILRNWGWSAHPSTNEDALVELSQNMQVAFETKGYIFDSVRLPETHLAAGNLMDWMAAKAKLVAFAVELCPMEAPYFFLKGDDILRCAEGAYAATLAFSEYLLENGNIPQNYPFRG